MLINPVRHNKTFWNIWQKLALFKFLESIKLLIILGLLFTDQCAFVRVNHTHHSLLGGSSFDRMGNLKLVFGSIWFEASTTDFVSGNTDNVHITASLLGIGISCRPHLHNLILSEILSIIRNSVSVTRKFALP